MLAPADDLTQHNPSVRPIVRGPIPRATPQIVIRGLSKVYGDFVAVDDVSLSIYKGEMFALVGASGCGKTTLLRMLAGFAQQSAGTISIDGVEMTACRRTSGRST